MYSQLYPVGKVLALYFEALAVGKSVVVTSDIAPMNEYIQNGFNGLLVEHFENASAVANAITLAIHNDTLRAEILANSRKSVNSFLRATSIAGRFSYTDCFYTYEHQRLQADVVVHENLKTKYFS